MKFSSPSMQSIIDSPWPAINFGAHWRGLEAARHLAIPSAYFLREFLERIGFQVEQ
jgi:hypothetical protein